MAEQLPYIVMIATIKAQIRKVIQVDFLLAYLYAHRHCDVFKPIYEALTDILEVVIAENEIDPAVETVKSLIPFISSTETEVSEMEYDIIRTDHIVLVRDDGFIHLTDCFEWAVAVSQYVGMVEVSVGSEEQPITVKLVVHFRLFLLWHPGGSCFALHERCNQADCRYTGYCRWFCLCFGVNDHISSSRYGCWL